MTRDEQLLEERQRRAVAEDVEGFENLGCEETTQHLVTANSLEQRDHIVRLSRIVARRFDRRGDKSVMGTRRLQVLRK